MVYRVLIVDDEMYIADSTAQRLKLSTSWEMEVDVAYSGSEALERIKTGKLDLLITDIRMPDMSGIELSSEMRRQWPMCQTIFLTAHAEFDYAYQALKQLTVEYVLKHEGFDALLSACDRAFERIGNAASREQIYSIAREQASASLPWMRRELLNDLAHGATYDEELVRRAQRQLEIAVEFTRPMAVAVVLLHDTLTDDTLYDRLARVNAIELTIHPCFPDNTHIAQSFSNEKRLLWLIQSDEPISTVALEGWLESAQEALVARLGVHASITFAPYISNYHELREIYQRLRAVHAGRSVGTARTMWLVCLDNEPKAEFRARDYTSLARAWRRAFLSGDDGADVLFLRLMDALRALDINDTLQYMEIYMTIAMQISESIHDMQLDERKLGVDLLLKLYQPQSHATLSEAVDYLSGVVYRVARARIQAAEEMENSIVSYVRAFILHHLAEASLDSVARHLHINASYLSRTYHQLTGETLTETITAAKLDYACDFLTRPGVRVQDIASALGFSTPAYFSFFFKKNMGVTPREYRDHSAK